MSTFLLQIVGWFSLPVLALLAGTLIWRKIPRKFPYFFSYIVVDVFAGLGRLWIYYTKPQSYISIYWLSEILGALVALLATYELFAKRLFPRFYTVRFYRYLFPIAATFIALFAVPAAFQTHKHTANLMIIHVFDVVRVTMLLFLAGIMAFMGRHWNRYEFGIAMGLVVEASALLMTSAIWTQRSFVHHLLDQLPAVSYDISSVIWLITFLKPEPPELVPAVPVSPEVLKEARKWEETLKGSLGKKKGLD